MLNPKFILRVSDLETAIKDYRTGLYSEQEFQAKIEEIAHQIDLKVWARNQNMVEDFGSPELIQSPKDSLDYYQE